jgi:mannose-6-phosphate isomerase-like protein (cupin superfamily)
MLVKRLEDSEEINALDNTIIRELLNPLHDKGNLHLGYSLAHAKLKPKEKSLPHRFKTASEVYYILSGTGLMHIDDETKEVSPGHTIYIPPMGVQYIENIGEGDLDFLCIVYPSWKPDAEELV